MPLWSSVGSISLTFHMSAMGKKSDILTYSPLFAECMAFSDFCMTGGDVPGECVLGSIAISSAWPL